MIIAGMGERGFRWRIVFGNAVAMMLIAYIVFILGLDLPIGAWPRLREI